MGWQSAVPICSMGYCSGHSTLCHTKPIGGTFDGRLSRRMLVSSQCMKWTKNTIGLTLLWWKYAVSSLLWESLNHFHAYLANAVEKIFVERPLY